nr:hypothetical protein [Tanacetum cinerariifolium]
EDIKAKVDADYQLAERLHAKEQEQLIDAEKVRLFMEFIKKRRKFFAAKKTEEKRNKPPTKAQQRSIMSTYMKNMDGWKPRALKNKSFAEIKKLFDKAMQRINSFVDFRTKLVKESVKKDEAVTVQESSSKRAGDELDQERFKKQRWRMIKSKKSLNNVWKSFQMMEMIEDLEVLWRLVKDRFVKTKPVDDMDSFLLHTLKTMFKHHVEDNVWRNQQGLTKVKNWKLFDSCRVHYVTM